MRGYLTSFALPVIVAALYILRIFEFREWEVWQNFALAPLKYEATCFDFTLLFTGIVHCFLFYYLPLVLSILQGTFPEKLSPAANSIVCTANTALLREIFNQTYTSERPIPFPPRRCRSAESRCEQCLRQQRCDMTGTIFTILLLSLFKFVWTTPPSALEYQKLQQQSWNDR